LPPVLEGVSDPPLPLSGELRAALALAAYAVGITIKTMRVGAFHPEIAMSDVVAIQIRGRLGYTNVRVRTIAVSQHSTTGQDRPHYEYEQHNTDHGHLPCDKSRGGSFPRGLRRDLHTENSISRRLSRSDRLRNRIAFSRGTACPGSRVGSCLKDSPAGLGRQRQEGRTAPSTSLRAGVRPYAGRWPASSSPFPPMASSPSLTSFLNSLITFSPLPSTS